jgi:hypothetical protein
LGSYLFLLPDFVVSIFFSSDCSMADEKVEDPLKDLIELGQAPKDGILGIFRVLVLSGERLKGLVEVPGDSKKSNPYVNLWVDDKKKLKLRTPNQFMTTKPVWNQELTWRGVTSPRTLNLSVKHFMENKHSKSLGASRHVFSEFPLSCTILFQNLALTDKNSKGKTVCEDQASVQLKMLWLPLTNLNVFNDIWNCLITLVSMVNNGDRKSLDFTVSLLKEQKFEKEPLFVKLLAVQKAFHLLNDFVLPGFSYPPDKVKLEAALAAILQHRKDISDWKGKYFTPPINTRLPSSAVSWETAEDLLKQRLEHIMLSDHTNNEVQEHMTNILQVNNIAEVKIEEFEKNVEFLKNDALSNEAEVASGLVMLDLIKATKAMNDFCELPDNPDANVQFQAGFSGYTLGVAARDEFQAMFPDQYRSFTDAKANGTVGSGTGNGLLIAIHDALARIKPMLISTHVRRLRLVISGLEIARRSDRQKARDRIATAKTNKNPGISGASGVEMSTNALDFDEDGGVGTIGSPMSRAERLYAPLSKALAEGEELGISKTDTTVSFAYAQLADWNQNDKEWYAAVAAAAAKGADPVAATRTADEDVSLDDIPSRAAIEENNCLQKHCDVCVVC